MRIARRLFFAAACTIAVLMAAPAVQAQGTKYLPSDTELVVTINLQQILKSEVFKANKTLVDIAKAKITEVLDEKEVGKYLKKANFDIFKDFTSITIAAPGRANIEEGFILLEGNFDIEKVESAIMEASKEPGGEVKVKSVKIANANAFEVTPKDEKTIYVGILDKKTMIACLTKADFAEAVGRVNGTKAGTFKSAVFKNVLQTTNSKQSISFAATGKILTKLAENNPNAGNDQAQMAMNMLKQVDGFSASITIQKDIDFQLGVAAKDAETAQQFAGIVSVALMTAKTAVAKQAKQNEKLEPLVTVMDTLKAEAKGPNLIVRGQISFDTLEKLLQNLPNP